MGRNRKSIRRSIRLFATVLVAHSLMTLMFGGVSSYGDTLTDHDISLIARITEAEAESESEYGKRLVIDSILNRIDQEPFPSSARDVIYQKGQFTCVYNGRIKKAKLKEETIQLVREEIIFRTNNRVVFFCNKGYSRFGAPLLHEGNHYFSIYGEG